MKSLVALLVLVAAAGAVPAPPDQHVKRLLVYGSPALTRGAVDEAGGVVPLDGVLSTEVKGWRSLYDKPFILAVQHDQRPELSAFLIRGGLASIPYEEETNVLHSALRSADDKVGILLSAAKFVNVPQVEMPITKFILPKGYTLAASARLHADSSGFPVMLLLNMADLKGFDLRKLALIGDFAIHADSVKVASDVTPPAAGRMMMGVREREGELAGVKRLAQHGEAAIIPKLGPYVYDYVLPGSSSIPKLIPHSEVAKYSLFV